MIRANVKGVKRRRSRKHPRERLAESLRLLKMLRDAEWMVSHDWGGNRDEILSKVDELLEMSKDILKEKP